MMREACGHMASPRAARGTLSVLMRLGASLLACAVSCGAAAAQPTVDAQASILVFPEVIADGQRDTVVQLTNGGNSMVHALCFYVNGAGGQCGQLAFDLSLARQQPTHWVVSRGRANDPNDPLCTPDDGDCDGAGIDPGTVPPAPQMFRGELVCIEVDASGSPLSGNHLRGEATLKDLGSGDVTAYNAIGLRGTAFGNGDPTLDLGSEYDACPQEWVLDHRAEGALDPVVGGGTTSTFVTIVPCTQNLAQVLPATVSLQLLATGELGESFTASVDVTCWAELSLADVDARFLSDFLGEGAVRTRITSTQGGGVIVVGEEVVELNPPSGVIGAAASNLHHQGALPGDSIELPAP